jgi:hypothetical protein
MSSWIDRAIAIRTVDEDDVPTDGAFRIWKFVGATLTPDGDRLVITIDGGGESTPIASPRGLGNVSGSAAVPTALTPTQITASLVNDATTSLPGRMTAAEKVKLSGIAAGATNDSVAISGLENAVDVANDRLNDIETAPGERLWGKASAGSGSASWITGSQATTLLDLATTAAKGLISATEKHLLGSVFNVRDYGALGYRSTFAANAGTNVITTSTPHNMAAGQAVNVDNVGGGLPGGLANHTRYYVIADSLGASTLKLSATLGGAEIDLSSAGTGTHTIYADDAAAFGLAFAAATPLGGVVFVPPGMYTIGGNVTGVNAAGAGSSILWRGCGSKSIIRFHFTGFSSYVFQFANLDGTFEIRDLAFLGSGGANDADAFVCILMQGNGRNVIRNCAFVGLRGNAGVVYGAVIQHNSDLTIYDTVFSACRGETAVIVSDGVRNFEAYNVKCVDVGSLNGEGFGKVGAEGAWYHAVDPQPGNVYGSADAANIRMVNCRWDEAPNALVRVTVATSGRRYQSVIIEQTHFLVPNGGTAVDIKGVEHVRLTAVDVGEGGNIAGASVGGMRFRDCRLVELETTHARFVTTPTIVTDADTKALILRNSEAWTTVGVNAATFLDRIAEEAHAVRARIKVGNASTRWQTVGDNFVQTTTNPAGTDVLTIAHDDSAPGGGVDFQAAGAMTLRSGFATTFDMWLGAAMLRIFDVAEGSELFTIRRFNDNTIATTSPIVPSGFQWIPPPRGATYEVTVRARLGATGRASWTFRFDAFYDGTGAAWTSGFPPVPVFSGSASMSGFQCSLELASPYYVRCVYQPDDATLHSVSMTVEEKP